MKKKSNFIIDNYRKSWKFFKDSKNYVYVSLIIFFAFAIFGFIFPIFFKQEIAKLIQSLVGKIAGLNLIQTIAYIIYNNSRASLLSIVFGILFGIFPIMTAVTNGYLIGFVARMSVSKEGVLVLWKLLPHGIFEIPAVIISMGIGIRLGIGMFGKKFNLKNEFIESLRFFLIVILPLLIIAGIIEGTLVYFLK